MTQRGARHLVLLSRSGSDSEANKTFIKELEDSGASVWAPKCDITDENRLRFVLDEASKTMPPIKGCIQGTSVLAVSSPPTHYAN